MGTSTQDGVDVVAKYRFGRPEFANEQAPQAFPQKCLPILPVSAEPTLHRFLEVARQSHLVITVQRPQTM